MKRSRLNPMSKKRRRQRASWPETRRAVIERDETCRLAQVLPTHQCWGGPHIHHIRRRSQGGTDELDNLALLCVRGHDFVHTHVAEAVLFGLLELRAGRPDAEEGAA